MTISFIMELIHVIIAGSIGLVFTTSILQHLNRPSTYYPIRILFREHYTPTLQNLQRDYDNQEHIYIFLFTSA
jgi:hypothetical protein